MRTAAVFAGIIALASAAPAAPNADASHENRQDRGFHIACDGKSNAKALNTTCFYRQNSSQGPILARVVLPLRSANAGPPPYTSTVSGYKPKYTSAPPGYTPKYTSTSTPHEYKPKYTSTSSEYNAYNRPHETPSYGPPEHTHAPYSAPNHTPSYSLYTSTSQYVRPHTTSHYEKPYSVSTPSAKPTSPPTCNFVEEECIDCNEYPEHCETCNFMFLCGEKKQCTYHGFREMFTMCKETGEECAWDESDHEYEHPHGEELEHGEKPEYPSHDEPENPYSEPEEPEHPSYDEPEHTYGNKPEHPHGVNDTEHEYPHGLWGSALRDNSTLHFNHTSV